MIDTDLENTFPLSGSRGQGINIHMGIGGTGVVTEIPVTVMVTPTQYLHTVDQLDDREWKHSMV